MAYLEKTLAVIAGILAIGLTAMKIRELIGSFDIVVDALAETNVRGDTVVIYRVANRSERNIFTRNIYCAGAEPRYGLPLPCSTIQEYYRWLVETGEETIGNELRRPHMTEAGSSVCAYLVIPGRRAEVDLRFVFETADGGRRINRRVKAINGGQQMFGFTV